jgi:hypothetical protein
MDGRGILLGNGTSLASDSGLGRGAWFTGPDVSS